MKRPTGWKANPQAMALVSVRAEYVGHPELGGFADPDTWLTPRWILDRLGSFDLDPCAADANQEWTQCRTWYVKADNGLTRPWGGRVFMNPPFSDTRPWIERHADYGIGISLVPASIESQVWRKAVWTKARAILLLHGRTRFCNPDGSATTGRPLRSVALIAWSGDDADILRGCDLAGVLLTDWRQR